MPWLGKGVAQPQSPTPPRAPEQHCPDTKLSYEQGLRPPALHTLASESRSRSLSCKVLIPVYPEQLLFYYKNGACPEGGWGRREPPALLQGARDVKALWKRPGDSTGTSPRERQRVYTKTCTRVSRAAP